MFFSLASLTEFIIKSTYVCGRSAEASCGTEAGLLVAGLFVTSNSSSVVSSSSLVVSLSSFSRRGAKAACGGGALASCGEGAAVGL